MPGHLVGGYLARAETVPASVLIDKQFRGLCTTAWAHSQALLSLPDKTVRSLRKSQGSPTFLGGPVTLRLMLWVKSKYQRFLRQVRSSGKLSHLAGLLLSFLPGIYCLVVLLPLKQGDLLFPPWLFSLCCRGDERLKDLFLQRGGVGFLRQCTHCFVWVIL